MKCPKCGGKVFVTDTAQHTDANETYRRKMCQSCQNPFFTVEFEIENTKELRAIWNTYKYNLSGGKK